MERGTPAKNNLKVSDFLAIIPNIYFFSSICFISRVDAKDFETEPI